MDASEREREGEEILINDSNNSTINNNNAERNKKMGSY